MMNTLAVRDLLEKKYHLYHQLSFISEDPISIPHRFTKKQDIEIAGFFAAILAWGQRKTIISKCLELMERMDNAPHDFVVNHQEDDLKNLLNFKHRTFNDTDLLYFIAFFRQHYKVHQSLEEAFLHEMQHDADYEPMEKCLIRFHDYFFSLDVAPARTRKHIATPARKSACKRLNMYLRWMVRKNDGIDFGLWDKIDTSHLICPCDLHVDRVARSLGLITRRQTDWETALELTSSLRQFDAEDPVRYDFALFGMGIYESIR